MSTLATMTVDSKVVTPINFNTSSFKGFSTLDASVTSKIQGGTVTFEIDLEEETDSDSFFATWFLDNSKKDALVDIFPAGGAAKFLTIECLDAQVVSYNVAIDQRIDTTKQNSTVLISLICLSITIGPAALTIGF
jgi:hypothetical protein